MHKVTWGRRRAYLRALKQKIGEPLGAQFLMKMINIGINPAPEKSLVTIFEISETALTGIAVRGERGPKFSKRLLGSVRTF